MDESRREFLSGAARLGSLASLAALGAHGAASAATTNARALPNSGGAYPFSLGVASGSPLPDAVVMWTRILYDPLNAAAMPPVALSVR